MSTAQIPPATPNTQVIIYQQGWLSRLVNWLAWAGLTVCLMLLIGQWIALADYFDTTGGIEERFVQGAKLATDKVVVLSVEGDAAVMAAVAEHRDYLMSETLASAWQKPKKGEFVAAQEQGEARWVIRLARDRGSR